MHRRFLLLTLLMFVPLLPLHRTAGSQTETCEGVVDGAKYPFLVPAHLAWNELWSRADRVRLSAGERERFVMELDVDAAVVDRITAIASSRRDDAELRTRPMSLEGIEAERALAARDALLRMVNVSSAANIVNWVDKQSRKPHSLGVRGRIIRLSDGRSACKVSIDGAKQPYLIPEHEYWGIYFRFLTNAAAPKRMAEGQYQADLLQALQEHHLPIPTDEVLTILEVAADATAKSLALESRAGESGDHLARLQQTAHVVLAARNHLLITLQPRSWKALRVDTERIRRSTLFDYPGV